MSYRIEIDTKVDKFLVKLNKNNPKEHDKILYFIHERLTTDAENPLFFKNCKKLQGFDNQYRWRLGAFRIIGKVINGRFKIIQIIKVDEKDDSTYKGL